MRRLAVVALAVLCASVAGAQGWGCYLEDHKIPGLTQEVWRAHVRCMKTAGMNTTTVSYGSAAQLTWMVDTMLEEEMLDSSIPVMVLPRCGEAEGRRVLGDAAVDALQKDFTDRGLLLGGWAPGEAAITAAIWERARGQSRFPDQWPEPIGYGPDEPHDEEKTCHEADCGERLNVTPITRMWAAAGWRHGTAVCHPHIRCLVPALDVVVANAILGADPTLEEIRVACDEKGAEYWVYEIYLRRATPEMIRWHVGWWFWQTRARVHLSWSWGDFLAEGGQDLAAPEIDERLAAYRQGVEDYRRLEALPEAAQAERRAMWDGEGWPWAEFIRARDAGDVNQAVPDFDFERLLPR